MQTIPFCLGEPPPSPQYEWEDAPPPNFLRELAQAIFAGDKEPQRRSLLAGLRAEAALRSGHWIEAINLTLTFHDAARRDFIEKVLDACIGHDKKITLNRNLTVEETKTLCYQQHGWLQTPCIQTRQRKTLETVHEIVSTREHDVAWSAFIGGHLQEMEKTLDSRRDNTSLRMLRNDCTHNVASATTLAAGLDRFEQSGLWQRRKQDNSLSLLGSPHPQAIIHDLGYREGNVLDNLCSELENLLLTPLPRNVNNP
jgi:hypothetical protein